MEGRAHYVGLRERGSTSKRRNSGGCSTCPTSRGEHHSPPQQYTHCSYDEQVSKATSRPQQRGENPQASRDDAGEPSLHRQCRQTQLMTTTNRRFHQSCRSMWTLKCTCAVFHTGSGRASCCRGDREEPQNPHPSAAQSWGHRTHGLCRSQRVVRSLPMEGSARRQAAEVASPHNWRAAGPGESYTLEMRPGATWGQLGGLPARLALQYYYDWGQRMGTGAIYGRLPRASNNPPTAWEEMAWQSAAPGESRPATSPTPAPPPGSSNGTRPRRQPEGDTHSAMQTATQLDSQAASSHEPRGLQDEWRGGRRACRRRQQWCGTGSENLRHADLPDGGHHTAATRTDDPDTGEQRGNRCERG